MPPSDLESRITRHIAARHAALLDDLKRHVALPTGGGMSDPISVAALDESRALLTDRLTKLGASCDLIPGDQRPSWLFDPKTGRTEGESPTPLPIPPTAICRRRATNTRAARRPVMIAGHLDTVHPSAGYPNTPGNFKELLISQSDGGKTAIGPGCVDMKGGLVIAIHALETLHELGFLQELDWSFVLNSDEEVGSYHSYNAIFNEAKRIAGTTRDSFSSETGRVAPSGISSSTETGRGGGGPSMPSAIGIALEPATETGGLVTQRGGSGQFMLEAHGKSAHVGRNFSEGVSAVYALARAILGAEALNDAQHQLIVNISPLQGIAATNAVPDLARAWGNVRFPDPAGAAVLAAGLDALAADHIAQGGTGGKGGKGGRMVVETSFYRAAKPLTPATEALAALARQVSEDLGRPLPFASTGGVCDGNIMQQAGLATLDTLGVRGGKLHTPHEWIELDSLVERCQMLALFILRSTQL